MNEEFPSEQRKFRMSKSLNIMIAGANMFVFCFLLFVTETKAILDTINSSQSIIDDGNTLVSAGGIFELKFFSPGNSKDRYLGIWYNQPSASEVVWVANRETPLKDQLGILKINHQGSVLIEDGRNITIWSTNSTKSSQNPVLQLLDSGNLVIRDEKDSNSDNYLWQSFDFPCDTFLPGMKIGRNFSNGLDRFLTSWKTADDPAPGQFSFWIDPLGFPQLIVRNGTLKHYTLGSWNGIRSTGTPDLPALQYLTFDFQLSKNEVYYSYKVSGSLITRLKLDESGFLQRYVYFHNLREWMVIYFGPRDQCDHYSVCGAYMSCKISDNSLTCACLEGFKRNTLKDDSKGCIRTSPLDCKNDFFQNYTGLKLPDTSLSKYFVNMSLQGCKEKCLGDCSCTAYADSDITTESSGCLLWYGDLMDMRDYGSNGQDLFIRMSTSRSDQNLRNKKKLVGITVGVAALLGLLIIAVSVYVWNKGRRSYLGDIELPIFDLNTIVKATDNFSDGNKLGQGGFGPVYKGKLTDEQEIAVKRLSKSSGQGMTEFKNEVLFIAKLQHRNLVRLLGCCIQGEEKLLIYEFMPNKSLDMFIFGLAVNDFFLNSFQMLHTCIIIYPNEFIHEINVAKNLPDPIRNKMIDWQKRFLIIGGIARGLLYLHQDSRLRIINRDLKTSNVLLDKDMNPKISDFGLARMVGADQTGANTNKVVGTYGYMSPEYAVDGLFSTKSDIFSFGVIVLEIMCGKKNRGFSHPDHKLNLVGHVWKMWTERRSLELLDDVQDESYSVAEALRCIHLGLLCVQQRPEDRPDMSSVVLILGSENPLPHPKRPGFYLERNVAEDDSNSGKQESSSTNEMTYSSLNPR